MLPGTIKMRVIGRYLYALSTVIMCMIICSLNLGIYALVSKELPPFVFEGTIFGASIALLFSSIQYIIFYALGKLKSQQLAGLIMMIPGFVMFFGVSFLASWMKENTVVVLEWLIDNHSLVVLLLTLCSVLSFLIGIILSTMIVNKKDQFKLMPVTKGSWLLFLNRKKWQLSIFIGNKKKVAYWTVRCYRT